MKETTSQPIAPASSTNSRPAASKAPASQSDQVHLSSTALAALQEASETPAQTAKEAHAGDRQAQKLLAKQSLAAKGTKNVTFPNRLTGRQGSSTPSNSDMRTTSSQTRVK